MNTGVVAARAAAPLGGTALALTAGGARGAYQAGVLQRIGEMPRLAGRPMPFEIVAGASAGAINGAALAGDAAHFSAAGARLAALWGGLSAAQVYRTGLAAMTRNGLRLASDFALRGLIGAGRVQAMLDAAPLRALLAREIRPAGIADAITRGHLKALAVTATGYHSGKSYTFVQGRDDLPLWHKRRRIARAATITADHVCASAAIPLVFPPVALDTGGTTAWFGDGAMRLTHPLSPAIRLGAQRLLAIGIRCRDTERELTEAELAGRDAERGPLRRPPLAQICGVFLNALFLDHLDADLDHLTRMNTLVAAYRREGDAAATVREPMRVIAPLVISPSEDFAVIATELAQRMPASVRVLIEALGRPEARSADLTSYLLFDARYTRALIDIGYRDATERIDEIEAFLFDESLETIGIAAGERC